MRHKPYLLLLGTIFVSRLAEFMIIPFLYLIVIQRGLGSVLTAGFVAAAASLTSSLIGLLGGAIADCGDRRIILFRACVASAAVLAGFAFAEDVSSYLACAVTFGLAKGFLEPASQALLSEVVPADRRQIAFAHRYLVINIAAVLGSLAGGMLALWHPMAIFLSTSGLLLLGAEAVRRLPKLPSAARVGHGTRPSIQHLIKLLWRDRAAQACFLAGFLLMFVYAQYNSTMSTFVLATINDGTHFFTILLGLNAFVVIVMQLPMTWLAQRIGYRGSVTLGTALFALGPFLLILFGPTTASFLTMIIFVAMGENLLFPISNSLFAELSAEETQATYMGLFNAIMLGRAAGPVVGSTLIAAFGFTSLLITMVGATLVSGLLYATVLRVTEHRKKQFSQLPLVEPA